jgi:hypothetical protein
MIQERGFLEHWFFLGFSLDLGYPVLLAGGFSGFCFWFFLDVWIWFFVWILVFL